VLAAMRAGAVGVLSKATLTPEALVSAVRATAGGTGVLAPGLLAQLLAGARTNGARANGTRTSAPQATEGLTARERRVLSLIAAGQATREVASELSYSERTVKNVLHDAVTKLHARSRTQAVAVAVRSGLI
jgi:DNA-binding NarL/FixJ family response regulator